MNVTADTTLFPLVLLVEDDASHALLISRAMRVLVGRVTHVVSHGDARAALARERFDLIVADLHLPDVTSGTHLGDYRAVAPQTPVIVLTSSTAVSEAVSAMQQGASDFIVKSFDAHFAHTLRLSFERVARETRVQRERLKLQREMAALRLAIENGSDALAVLKADGTIEYANGALHDFAVRTEGRATSLTACFGLKVKERERLAQELQERVATLGRGGAWTTEAWLTTDEPQAFSVSLSVILDGTQDRQLVLWLRDISEAKRRERVQRELLSTTTHDLKGPLGAIMLSAELVSEQVKEQGKVAELVTRISSAAHGAVNLIDELLSARRIEEGMLVLRPSKVSLMEVLAEAVAGFEPAARARKLKLQLEVPEGLQVVADRIALQRVVSNLVSNAIKFTPGGGAITVKAMVHDASYVVEVIDTGHGIEPGELATLFEQFRRLEKHQGVDGTGLGLFVVRSIVAAHGGQVQVASTPGEGSTFAARLPLDPPVDERGELVAV